MPLLFRHTGGALYNFSVKLGITFPGLGGDYPKELGLIRPQIVSALLWPTPGIRLLAETAGYGPAEWMRQWRWLAAVTHKPACVIVGIDYLDARMCH